MTKEQLLTEIGGLLRTVPPQETIRHEAPENLAWLGRLSAAIGNWDSAKAQLLLNRYIVEFHSDNADTSKDGLRKMMTLLHSAQNDLRLQTAGRITGGLSPTLSPPHLKSVVLPKLLRIHSKQLKGAELDLCLDEAYDVFATALKDDRQSLTEPMLNDTVPAWVLRWANYKRWFGPWLLLELGTEAPNSFVTFGDYQVGKGVKSDILKRLASRIAYWEAEALEHGTHHDVIEPVLTKDRNLEAVTGGEAPEKRSRNKRGPQPNIQRYLAIAAVVEQIDPNWNTSPSWTQRDVLETICEALEDAGIGISNKWKKWDSAPRGWISAVKANFDNVKKGIQYALRIAKTNQSETGVTPHF